MGPTGAPPVRATEPQPGAVTGNARAVTIALAWLGMTALDFLLHGGVLAPLYDWDSPFLVDPSEALLRVPLGYLGLALQATVVYWLLARLGVRHGTSGAAVAAALGGSLWGAFIVGLASISTAPISILVGWLAAEVAELGLAGWIVASRFSGRSPRWLASRIVVLAILAVILTVILQTTGYASGSATRG